MSTIDLTSDSEDDNDRKPSAKDKQEGVIAIDGSSDDDSITARKKRPSTGVASTTRPKKKKRIDPPPTLSSTAYLDVSTSTDLETNRKRKGSPSSLNDDDVEIVEVSQVKKKRRKKCPEGGCGGCDAHRQQLNAEQLKEQEDMERVTYQDDDEDDDDDDKVIVVNGCKQAAVLTAEEVCDISTIDHATYLRPNSLSIFSSIYTQVT